MARDFNLAHSRHVSVTRLISVSLLLVCSAVFLWQLGACAADPEVPPPKLTIGLESDVLNEGETTLTLLVKTDNFKLDATKIGKENVQGEGHYRVYLDKEPKPLTESADGRLSVTMPKDLAPGAHSLRVQLRQNDKSPLSPNVELKVPFTTRAKVKPRPRPQPKPPTLTVKADKSKVKRGETVTLTLTIANLKLVDPENNISNQSGEGHIRIFLDKEDKALAVSFAKTVAVKLPDALTIGDHTLRVALYNNNRTPIEPKVEATVALTSSQQGPNVQVSIDVKEVYAGKLVTLTVTPENFQFNKAAMGKANKQGEGHFRVYLDDKKGKDYLVADAVRFVLIDIPAETKAGAHTLRVELVNHDGTPLKPAVEAKVSVQVKVKLIPKVGLLVSRPYVNAGSTLGITVGVDNFKLLDYRTKPPNKWGQGHYKIYLSNNPKATLREHWSTSGSVRIPASTKPGFYKLIIILMNSDRTPVSPRIEGSVTIQVIARGIAACEDYFIKNTGCTSFSDRSASKAERVISFTGMAYNPKCIKVKVGQTLEFQGDFTRHPLRQACGVQSKITSTSTGNFTKFTFTRIGTYGYYCTRHSNPLGQRMAGMIQVVPANSPSLLATASTGGVFAGQSFKLTLQTENFTFVQIKGGTPNKSGQGHYRVFLQSSKETKQLYQGHLANPTITVPATTVAGKYTIKVVLYNNNRTPLKPETAALIDMNVDAPVKACPAAYQTAVKCKTFTDRTGARASRIIGMAAGNRYNPPCIKIKVGQRLTFRSNFSFHPLKQACGVASTITSTTAGTQPVSFAFTKAGTYGYYCTRHGNSLGVGMAGMIQVVP